MQLIRDSHFRQSNWEISENARCFPMHRNPESLKRDLPKSIFVLWCLSLFLCLEFVSIHDDANGWIQAIPQLPASRAREIFAIDAKLNAIQSFQHVTSQWLKRID